jgi:serine O-acetyltransferase
LDATPCGATFLGAGRKAPRRRAASDYRGIGEDVSATPKTLRGNGVGWQKFVLDAELVRKGGRVNSAEAARAAYFRLRVRACTPLAALALSSRQREVIRADAARWADFCEVTHAGGMDERDCLSTILVREPAFRNLLYYRLSDDASSAMEFLLLFSKRIWKPLASLRFGPESLGPGCFILHGWETGIDAKSIGANFNVAQHVTIGYREHGKEPTIGDNVTILVGAIVIGDIRIGDGATVGAGAVVVHDVPDGATVVGVPAHPVARRVSVEVPAAGAIQ